MAAQSKFSFMLVLCSRQIPAKANKLILSLILSYISFLRNILIAYYFKGQSWGYDYYLAIIIYIVLQPQI